MLDLQQKNHGKLKTN